MFGIEIVDDIEWQSSLHCTCLHEKMLELKKKITDAYFVCSRMDLMCQNGL